MAKRGEPRRFRELMRGARRDRAASKAVVSILRADGKASQTLERALGAAGLSLPQFNVLMVLAASPAGAVPLFELNAQLVSTPPNTSWISNRMEERGLVTKRRDDTDRRVVLIELTEKGWAALGRAAPLVFEAEKDLVGGYSRAELEQLADLLGRFLD
ncbi:MAG TPA: MarR family transcriptional regulator [Actinomycetota bacterium]|nr:MarR family transcriptional regulator [Actinomycetota bacterium]